MLSEPSSIFVLGEDSDLTSSSSFKLGRCHARRGMTTVGDAVSDAHIAAYARELLENSKKLLNDDRVIPIRQAFIICGYCPAESSHSLLLWWLSFQQRCRMLSTHSMNLCEIIASYLHCFHR